MVAAEAVEAKKAAKDPAVEQHNLSSRVGRGQRQCKEICLVDVLQLEGPTALSETAVTVWKKRKGKWADKEN